MGSGVEATAHLAEVEFRSQGQYRTRIRRTNRSLSAILAAHDFVPHSYSYSCSPPSAEASVAKILWIRILNENRKGSRAAGGLTPIKGRGGRRGIAQVRGNSGRVGLVYCPACGAGSERNLASSEGRRRRGATESKAEAKALCVGRARETVVVGWAGGLLSGRHGGRVRGGHVQPHLP